MNEQKNFIGEMNEQRERGDLIILGRRDTFEFACVQCGECCRNREDILLNPFDFFRLCKLKEMGAKDFAEKYCEIYSGYSSKLPIVRVKFRLVYDTNDNITGTRCPFLGKKDNLYYCRVHKAKPFVCFAYPLGRSRKKLGNPEYVLQAAGTCTGAKKAKKEGIRQVVEDWMRGKEKLDIEERYNNIFSKFLAEYFKWINVEKLANSKFAEGKLYTTWLSMTEDLLFNTYDFEADENAFLKQLEKNIKTIEEISKKMVHDFVPYINLKPKVK